MTGTNEPKIRGSDDADADRRGSSTPSGFDDPFSPDGGDDVDFDAVASDDDDVIGERKTTREKDAFVTKETKKASKRHLNKRLADDDPRVAKERADLELLMMDDDAVLGDFGATTRAKPVDARNVDTSTLGTLGETRTSSAVSKKKSRKARLAEKKKTRGKDARRRESDDEDSGRRRARAGSHRKPVSKKWTSPTIALPACSSRRSSRSTRRTRGSGKPKPPSSSRRNARGGVARRAARLSWRRRRRGAKTETREKNAKKTAARKTRAARAASRCARWSKG